MLSGAAKTNGNVGSELYRDATGVRTTTIDESGQYTNKGRLEGLTPRQSQNPVATNQPSDVTVEMTPVVNVPPRLRTAYDAHQVSLQAYRELERYMTSYVTPTGVAASLQSVVALAATTGATFGGGVTGGTQMAAYLDSAFGQALPANATRPQYWDLPRNTNATENLAKGMFDRGAGAMFGGFGGAIGNMFSALLITPLLTAVAESLSGGTAVQKPVPLNHLYPDPNPLDANGRPKGRQVLEAEWTAVYEGRRKVEELQKQHTGLATSLAHLAGAGAFGLANVIRAVSQQEPISEERLGTGPAMLVGIGTSAFGGALTAAVIALVKAHLKTTVPMLDQTGQPLLDEQGQPRTQQLNVFRSERVAAPVLGADATTTEHLLNLRVPRNILAAMKNFNGGREGWAILNNALTQFRERTAGISSALWPAVFSGIVASFMRNQAPGNAPVRGVITAMEQLFNLSVAVRLWFNKVSELNSQLPHATTQRQREELANQQAELCESGSTMLANNCLVISNLAREIRAVQARGESPAEQEDALARMLQSADHCVKHLRTVPAALTRLQATPAQLDRARAIVREAEERYTDMREELVLRGVLDDTDSVITTRL